MGPQIRKLVTTTEVLYTEAGRAVDPPIRSAVVAAVVVNPWAGQDYVEDLEPAILEVAPALAALMVPAMIDTMGGPEGIEAFGKAAIVGMSGEIEHASALIHTLRFGNVFRTAAEGSSFLSFTNKRGAPGATVTFPLIHKNDRSVRSHYLTVETVIPDAPGTDEILVAIGAASAGRPFARIGDRHRDVATGAV